MGSFWSMVATLSGSPGFGVGGPGCLILELGGDPTYYLFWSEVFRGRVMHRLDAPAPYGCCRDFCRLRCPLPSIFGKRVLFAGAPPTAGLGAARTEEPARRRCSSAELPAAGQKARLKSRLLSRRPTHHSPWCLAEGRIVTMRRPACTPLAPVRWSRPLGRDQQVCLCNR